MLAVTGADRGTSVLQSLLIYLPCSCCSIIEATWEACTEADVEQEHALDA